MSLRVSELYLFPVKSCGSLSVTELRIGEAGPEIARGDLALGDRQLMFVDSEGKFLTQRTLPKMAKLQPLLQNHQLFLQIENQKFEIPLKMEHAPRLKVSVWGKEVEAARVEGPVNEAASELLNRTVQLVSFDQHSERESLLKGKGLGVQTRFTDSQQFLIVTEESLLDLNSRLQKKIGADRFRANVILTGTPQAYDEDHWQSFGNDSIVFERTKACARCKIITVDPTTGTIPDSEPLIVLSKYRKQESSVYFGHYFLSRSFGKILKTGEMLEISQRKPS